jgi:peptidoglycan/xylan/chitin deacetylase (PgdA/CDA1 family)
MMLRPLLSLLTPAGRAARLSVLIYHRVLPSADPLLTGDPDATRFRWQMRILRNYWNPLPLDEAIQRLRSGSLPARAVAVTFDDGYADNATQALPILLEEGVPATFFIATGFLNGGRMFNDTVIETVRRLPAGSVDLSIEGLCIRAIASDADRIALIQDLIMAVKYRTPAEREVIVETLAQRMGIELPDDLMMTDGQVRQLADSGMGIGGHTIKHPILASIAPEDARREMREGKTALQAMINRPVTLFAYPNGRPGKDYAPEHVEMAREAGFEAAFSTAWGTAQRDSDPYQLPRFTPWDPTPFRFGLRMAQNLLRR